MSRALGTQVRTLRLLGTLLIAMAAMGTQAQGNSPTVSVAITSPGKGAVIALPGAVQLGATASINLPNWQIREVAFYSGSTLIGISTRAPYGISWPSVPAGTYTITAQAIAIPPAQAKPNLGTPNLPTWTGVSTPVSFRVNAPPTVSLAAPAAGAVFNPPAAITLAANAADADGTIAKVEFYSGSTLIGTVAAGPYSVSWANPAPGSYSLTARAIDNDGAATTSSALSIRVNAPPTVSLITPAAGTVVNQGVNVTMAATAADTDGTVAMVDFYQGATLVGTATSAPYSITLTNLAAGTYNLRAVTTDNDGASSISSVISVRVNAPPSVSLTSPASGASFTAPAAVNLAATAADSDGTIARVEFLQSTTLLATVTAVPYSFTWSNVAAGSYSLAVRATDNDGAVITSTAVNVTVKSAMAQIYYIHSDHLNTPRLIADSTGTTVWKWDQLEPFGNDLPNDNPSGVGAFEFNLRFPGQYYDRETNLAYNYFRDYDPGIGRYVQSDPIGLAGGINTFGYVSGRPMNSTDPFGLDETFWSPGKGRSFLDGPRNGNWCGGNWSGGRVPSLNGGRDGVAPPLDSLDSCCKVHDDCFATCDKRPKPLQESCYNTCNKGLIGCLQELGDDCTAWPKRPRRGTESDSQNYRADAIRLFTQKVQEFERRQKQAQ